MENQVGVQPVQARAKFEETNVGVNVYASPLNSVEQRRVADQQIVDDDKLIPNIGDERIIEADGKIGSPDGETFIPTKLTFIRKRNQNGGVDVTCHIPCLGAGSGIN